MESQELKDDNFFNFFLLSDNYIDKLYSKQKPLLLIFVKLNKFIQKFIFHFFLSILKIKKFFLPRNKIIFYTISKNNYDSLEPIYKKLIKNSIFLSSDFRLSKNTFLFPLIIPIIISFLFIPSIIINIIKESRMNKKRYLLFFNDILLSIGFKSFITFYLKLLKPKAIIFANDHSFYARMLVKAAGKKNIPCFYIQHSAVTNIFPKIISNFALLEGKDSLVKYYNSEQLEKGVYLIGSPKFDKHYNKINNNKKIKSIGICSTDSMDKDQVLELIYMVKNKFNKNTIYFRPHPGERISSKYKNNKILDNINYSDPLKEDSFDFLKKVDVVISGNSSIILESTMMNVYPILWLDSKATSKYNDNPNDKYGFIQNGLSFPHKTINEINDRLNQLLINKPEVRSKARYYIENINTDWDGKSSEFAAKIISENI